MIDVIVPVKNIVSAKDKELLIKAFQSLNSQVNRDFTVNLFINNAESGVLTDLVTSLNNPPLIHIYDEDYSYTELINYASSMLKNDYFIILEQDDVFQSKHFQNFYKNSQEKCAMYLNLSLELSNGNEVMGIRNEIFWSVNVNNQIGNVSHEIAKRNVNNLSLDGAFINREKFIEYKGYREDIEIFFNQELILRFAYKGETIYVIPKMGVHHMMNRDGSYLDVCSQKYSRDDIGEFHTKMMKIHMLNKK